MKKLYNFEMLSKKMDEWGFPKLNVSSGFRIIKDVDFEKAIKSGAISFTEDGIYLEYERKKYLGYMFIREYHIQIFGYPKFHLVKCEKIEEFINEGRFKDRYVWSNSNVNDVVDMDTGEVHKNIELKLCGYCRKKLMLDKVLTTNDFFEQINKERRNKQEIEVDIFGYERGFDILSKNFRSKKGYICESCGLKPRNSIDRKYWHTHHKDGNKINNDESNLQCLCLICHIYVDKHHEEKLRSTSIQIQLKHFIKLYGDELRKVNNQYFKKYYCH